MTPGECTFNIVKFGSRHESLFELEEGAAGAGPAARPGAGEYDEVNFKLANGYIEGVNSDMGVTNILDPLREVLRKQTETPNHKRQVFLLIGGTVTNQSILISTGNRFNQFIN